MLIATNYARKMSLDMRLIDEDKYDDHIDNKASHCTALISQYYKKYDEHKGTQFVSAISVHINPVNGMLTAKSSGN